MVVIPCILEDGKKVKELAEKLEVFYLANKSENMYFTILGDPTSSTKEVESIDDEIKKIRNKRGRKIESKVFNRRNTQI